MSWNGPRLRGANRSSHPPMATTMSSRSSTNARTSADLPLPASPLMATTAPRPLRMTMRTTRRSAAELTVALDERLVDPGAGTRRVSDRWRRTSLHGLLEQRDRLRARGGPQLLAENPFHLRVPTERRCPISRNDGLAQQLEMGLLVGGVEAEDVGPASGPAEQLLVTRGEPQARLLGPGLVQIGGQQLTSVERKRRRAGVDRVSTRPQRGVGRGVERDQVDVDVNGHAGEQGDDLRLGYHRVALAERLPGEVGGLMQPRQREVEVDVRPERVDHAVAVQLGSGREGEELHERRGMAAAPPLVGEGDAVDADGEAAHQGYPYPHR